MMTTSYKHFAGNKTMVIFCLLLMNIMGVYHIGSNFFPFGNIQMALQQAGGANAGAQLDKMQINRNGEIMPLN